MIKANSILKALLGIMVYGCLLVGCSSDYDDTKIWDAVNDLDRRVTNIESTLSNMSRDIITLQTLVSTIQTGVTITNVTQTSTGYTITFSDGKVITLKNGVDGATPTIGSDGYWYINGERTEFKAVGSDGATPTVGTDGYWYINGVKTEYKAVGNDGATPTIGADGYWYINGIKTDYKAVASNGLTPYIGDNGNWWIGSTDTHVPATGSAQGGGSTIGVPIISVAIYEGVYYWTQTINGITTWITDNEGNKLPVSGKSAVIPMIQVNIEGYWVISYDNGITWVVITDENGKAISASEGGECHCETFFQSVIYADGLLTIKLIDGTTVQIKCDADRDVRFDLVLPDDLQEKLESHMPIYRGLNPPNVTGVYIMNPTTTVYCTDFGNGGFAPNVVTNTLYMRFKNQDALMHTLDYDQYEVSVGNAVGKGVFISGSDNNFTAYFNIESNTYDIYSKQAIVISGTKTDKGISNLYYAVAMVEKGSDPQRKMMNAGVIRVFRDGDGTSEYTSWPAEAQDVKADIWTLFSMSKND